MYALGMILVELLLNVFNLTDEEILDEMDYAHRGHCPPRIADSHPEVVRLFIFAPSSIKLCALFYEFCRKLLSPA